MSERLDGLGDPMPPGYVRWTCELCTAVCNFEAMHMCAQYWEPGLECPHDRDQPESNGAPHGAFGFMIREDLARKEADL